MRRSELREVHSEKAGKMGNHHRAALDLQHPEVCLYCGSFIAEVSSSPLYFTVFCLVSLILYYTKCNAEMHYPRIPP